MSALHQAVARAIAEADGVNMAVRDAHGLGVPDVNQRQAAVAVRVVLAEATRAVEALPPVHENCELCAADPLLQGSAVLAALAALGEHA